MGTCGGIDKNHADNLRTCQRDGSCLPGAAGSRYMFAHCLAGWCDRGESLCTASSAANQALARVCRSFQAADKELRKRTVRSGAAREAVGHCATQLGGAGWAILIRIGVRCPQKARRSAACGEAGDRACDDFIAILGPPATFDDEVEEAPGEKFDGVDDPVELDWAAEGTEARPGSR